jgi:2-keto-myo-inositol isomerase
LRIYIFRIDIPLLRQLIQNHRLKDACVPHENGPIFAVNHMAAPKLSVPQFFALANELGLQGVEIRNDIAGNALLDGTPAGDIGVLARQHGLNILTINALQRFNEWTDARAAEADALAAACAACGAGALILVPKNDGTGCADGERVANLRVALTELAPILAAHGITGLVEPLGFEICSLRLKSEAVAAIEALGLTGKFHVTHDTFHHHLAGEATLFPDHTGLVHISGVSDPSVSVADMRDSHRVLVDAADRIDNVGQMRALRAAGYNGSFSFEPFAASVHALADPAAALRQSMNYIEAALKARAA